MIELIFDPVMLESLIGFAFAGQMTKEMDLARKRTALKTMPGSYEARMAVTPSIVDIAAGRGTEKQMKAYILGTEPKKVTQAVTPKAAVAAGGTGGLMPNPVVYIGGDVGGQVAPTVGGTGGAATQTGAPDMVVKKKKLLGS